MTAVTITCGLLVFLYPEIKQDYVLSLRGQQAVGTLVDRFCGRQPSAAYLFKVGAVVLRGRSALGNGTAPCWSLRSDDQMVLYYLPDDPSVNALGNPRENFKTKMVFWTVMLFILNVLIALSPLNGGRTDKKG